MEMLLNLNGENMKSVLTRFVAIMLTWVMVMDTVAFAMPSAALNTSPVDRSLVVTCCIFNSQTVVEPMAWFFHHGFTRPNEFHSISKTVTDSENGISLSPLIQLGLGIAAITTLVAQALFLPGIDATPGVSLAGAMAGLSMIIPSNGHEVPKAFDHLLEGVGENTSDWQRLDILVTLILDQIEEKSAPLAGWEIEEMAIKTLQQFHLPTDPIAVMQMLKRLVDLGVLQVDGGYYRLGLPPSVLAIKFDAVPYMARHLKMALEAYRDQIPGAEEHIRVGLTRYAQASDMWPRYPVDAKRPFLKAVAILPRRDQKLLEKFIEEHDGLRDLTLVDDVMLMLQKNPPIHWLRRFAKHLLGRRIYMISAECWYAAGGLGRVMQYHTIAMARLAQELAELNTVEPYYPYRLDADNKLVPLDYRSLAVPVENLPDRPNYEYTFNLANQSVPVPVEEYEGSNRFGIHVALIKDKWNYYTRLLYRYGQYGTASKEEFIGFNRHAMDAYVRRREHSFRNQDPEHYKAPIESYQDGQMIPGIEYSRQMDMHDDILWHSVRWGETHTILNREVFEGRDATSRLRQADGAGGVSAVHVDEIAGPTDPEAKVVSVANGDDADIMQSEFRAIWRDLIGRFPELFVDADIDHPTPEQMLAVKREAKIRWGLNPEQPVTGYLGRLVDEKAGRTTAFTDENIRILVAAGVQVVLFANVQAHTQPMFDALQLLANEVNAHGPGRLIVKTGWNIPEQVKFLPAVDLGVVPSTRRTGASEFSETGLSRNGAVILAPPGLEGTIQTQGMPFNYIDGRPDYQGNTILPHADTAAAYLKAMETFTEHLRMSPTHAAAGMSRSVELANILDSLVTGAEYLRQFDRLAEMKDNPLAALVPLLHNEPDAKKYFRHSWVRSQLTDFLETHPDQYPAFISSDARLKAFVVPLNGKKYIVSVTHPYASGDIHAMLRGGTAIRAALGDAADIPSTEIQITNARTGRSFGFRAMGDLEKAQISVGVKEVQILELNSIDPQSDMAYSAKSIHSTRWALAGAVGYGALFAAMAHFYPLHGLFTGLAIAMALAATLFIEEYTWMVRQGVSILGRKTQAGQHWISPWQSSFRARRTGLHEWLVHYRPQGLWQDVLLAPFLDLVGFIAALGGLHISADEKLSLPWRPATPRQPYLRPTSA